MVSCCMFALVGSLLFERENFSTNVGQGFVSSLVLFFLVVVIFDRIF